MGALAALFAALAVASALDPADGWFAAAVSVFSPVAAIFGVRLCDRMERTDRRANALHEELLAYQKEASSELETTQRRYNELRRVAPVGVFDANAEGSLVSVSPKWREITGMDEKDAVDTGWLERVHPDDRARVKMRWREATAAVRPFETEYRVRRRNDEVFVIAQAVPQYDSNNRLQGWVGTLTDVTIRKRAEAERQKLHAKMQETQKLESLGMMAGGIAHDFNNLLVGIMGNVDLALRHLDEPDRSRDFLQGVLDSSRQAADLSSQLLAYSGRGAFIMEDVDLAALLHSSRPLLESAIEKRHSINIEVASEELWIEGDPSQVRQVVYNLLVNAAEAVEAARATIFIRADRMTPEAAWLDAHSIEAALPGMDYAVLEISDNGPGIDDVTRASIFDPFFSTKFAGRGLGLAVVHRIIERHGGAIEVSSGPQGTTFRIAFPTSTPPPHVEAAAPETDHEAWRGSGCILVVDDDPGVQAVHEVALSDHGFASRCAENGEYALATFDEHRDEIVAVVLDLTMPGMSGEEVLAELEQRSCEVPVILSSGYSELEIVAQFGNNRIAGFLQKPFRPIQLIELLRQVLTHPSA